MTHSNWFSNLFRNGSQSSNQKRRAHQAALDARARRRTAFRRVVVEGLEDRRLLTAVAETEPNDTLATAQVLTAADFDLSFNPDIHDTALVNTSTVIPHAEIAGGAGDGSYDYFSFTTATPGSIVIADIDRLTGVFIGVDDTEIAIWDAAGNVIASNDDAPFGGDPGSLPILVGGDSFIETILPAAGTYTIGVSSWFDMPSTGGFNGGGPGTGWAVFNTPYTLNLSVGSVVSPTVTVAANDTFAEEVLSPPGVPNNGQFTFSASPAPASDLVISYSVGGTATPGDDYTPLSGTATILAGQMTATVDLDIIDDLVYDGDLPEDVVVTITGATLGYAGSGAASIKIGDNETAPTVSITASDPNAKEDTDNGEYTVGLSGPTDTATTVSITYSGTAVSGADYTAATSATIPAGATQVTIPLTPQQDPIIEGDETAIATLASVTSGPGVTIGSPSVATVTIADEPDTGVVTISSLFDASELPVGPGVTNSAFLINQSGISSTDTVVSYTQSGSPLATPGVDFVFAPIFESQPVESNDSIVGPQAGTGPQGLGGFFNGQQKLISLGGNDGSIDIFSFYTSTGGSATFDLTNTGVSAFNAVLRLFDASGTQIGIADPAMTNDASLTANLPAAGLYYIGVYEGTSLTNGPDPGEAYELDLDVPGSDGFAVIGAGDNSFQLPINVIDDSIVEPTEEINMTIGIVASDPDITLGPMGTEVADMDLTDDDSATVNIAGTQNGLEGAVPINGLFTVTMSTTSSTNTVIPFTVSGTALEPGNAGITASNPQDHSLANGNVTILAGQTSATISVPVIDSDLIEEDETVIVTLGTPTSPPSNTAVSIGTGSDSILIGDDDLGVVNVDATVSRPLSNRHQYRVSLLLACTSRRDSPRRIRPRPTELPWWCIPLVARPPTVSTTPR